MIILERERERERATFSEIGKKRGGKYVTSN